MELNYNDNSIDSVIYAYNLFKLMNKKLIILITSEIFDHDLLKALSKIRMIIMDVDLKY